MPINADNAKMTLDFVYQWEDDESKAVQNMYIRYYVSEEYGPTIAISTDQQNYTGYPAEMFDEIVDFLEGQLGKKRIKQEAASSESEAIAQQPASSPVSPSLPIPNIEKSQKIEFSETKPVQVKSSNATNTEPVQSFNASSFKEEASQEAEVAAPAGEEADSDYSEEEVQKMWQARKEAVQKAKTSKKGIKSKHKKQDEDE